MFQRYLASVIITNLPQKSSFAFLLEASTELTGLQRINASQETEHLSVILQIVSPLANKLYIGDTTCVQVFRCLWFSSRNYIFLDISQLKRRLDLGYRVGLMFPLNLLLHFFTGNSLSIWNPVLAKPFLQFSWHVCSEMIGSHSFYSVSCH